MGDSKSDLCWFLIPPVVQVEAPGGLVSAVRQLTLRCSQILSPRCGCLKIEHIIYIYIYISLYIKWKNGKCHREMMINHEIRRVLSLFVETTPYRLAAYITPFIPVEHPWYPDIHDIFRNRSCQKHPLYPLFKKGIDHVKNMLDPLKKHPDLYSSCCYTCRMPLRSCLKLGQLVFQRLNLSSCARFSSDWML